MTEKNQADYSPWQPPFIYNRDGHWIEDVRGNLILAARGWGYLTGKGSQALGLEDEEAAKILDSIGERVADLMNRDAPQGIGFEDLLNALREKAKAKHREANELYERREIDAAYGRRSWACGLQEAIEEIEKAFNAKSSHSRD